MSELKKKINYTIVCIKEIDLEMCRPYKDFGTSVDRHLAQMPLHLVYNLYFATALFFITP